MRSDPRDAVQGFDAGRYQPLFRGRKAFTNYLGPSEESGRGYDASELVARSAIQLDILIDQGAADKFLAEQPLPKGFATAARKSGQTLNSRMQVGCDHGYCFIQTFIADHLQHHAARWRAEYAARRNFQPQREIVTTGSDVTRPS